MSDHRSEVLLMGMRVAMTTAEDLQCVMQVMSFFEALREGWLPDSLTDNPEANMAFFDIDDPAACQTVLRKLLEINDAGSSGRAVLGLRAMLNPRNEVLDLDSDVVALHPRLVRALQGAEQAKASEWLPLLAPGQIQPGDFLSFTVGGKPVCAIARQVLFAGTDREEIVYNRQRNHYFITAMALDGTSTHKRVFVRSVTKIEVAT
jgi:hypothetical protein